MDVLLPYVDVHTKNFKKLSTPFNHVKGYLECHIKKEVT